MRAYKEIAHTQIQVVASEITCDRCGESARVIGAPGDRLSWGTFEACESGTTDLVQMDLCRQCTLDIIEFLMAHPRAVKRTQRDRLDAIGKAVREEQ